jgi:ABC-2 type transport system ATP-binding protein
MIEVRNLTKRYGETVAVDDLSFEVRPGMVTGFLGPNGAGKSTTMRMILGLDHPTAGQALIDGRRYRTLSRPLREVGALIESDALHPARSGRHHLRVAARSNGIPLTRVDEVLEQVGLAAVAGRRVKSYSLGMRQRLGIAAALIGDPAVLLFDEPVNGLDVDGVRWVRHLVRDLAAEGRTVLVSSHLMSEMQQTADHLVVIGRGRLIADASTHEVLARTGGQTVRVRAADPEALVASLARLSTADVERLDDGALLVSGVSPAEIGDAARHADLTLHELTELSRSLEQAFLQLTADDLDYASPTVEPGPAR